MQIQTIDDRQGKQRIARVILELLPEWFGIPEAREAYIRESADEIMVTAAAEEGSVKGFLCLKETGKATVELVVMGVLKQYHRQGIGTALAEEAKRIARERGYSFLQVKTVQMGHYPEYDATNRFYRSLGFQEFEVIQTLWDEENPCQIYVMSVAS